MNENTITGPLLSIVIPVLNEAAKIGEDIRLADAFLKTQNIHGEIIVADDGSTDNTAAVVQLHVDTVVHPLHLVSLKKHSGKGAAVREGVLSSSGSYVLFTDSGNCTPLKYINVGIDLLQSGRCSLAHGSRFMRTSRIIREQSKLRQQIGYAMRRLFHVFLPLPQYLTDTQCGFKLYRGECARFLYQQLQSCGSLFDLEIILTASKAHLNICEFPIEWDADPDSRTATLRNIWTIAVELLKLVVRFRL